MRHHQKAENLLIGDVREFVAEEDMVAEEGVSEHVLEEMTAAATATKIIAAKQEDSSSDEDKQEQQHG